MKKRSGAMPPSILNVIIILILAIFGAVRQKSVPRTMAPSPAFDGITIVERFIFNSLIELLEERTLSLKIDSLITLGQIPEVEKLLLSNEVDLSSKKKNSRCIFIMSMGAYFLQVQEDYSTASKIFTLGQLHCEQNEDDLPRLLKSLLEKLPYNQDEYFLKEVQGLADDVRSCSDSTGKLLIPPSVEICHSLKVLCEHVDSTWTLDKCTSDCMREFLSPAGSAFKRARKRGDNMSASIQTGITQYSSLEDFHPADHHPLTDQPNLNKSQEALTPEEELALEVSSLKKQIADEYSRYEKTHQSMNRVFQQCAYDYNLGQSHYSFRSQRFASDQIGLSINLEIKLLDEEAEERIILEKALDCFVSSILNYEKRKGYRFSDKQTTLTVEVPAKFDNYKPLLLAKLATLSLKVSWTKGDQLRFLVNINSIDFLENAFLECRQNVTDLERAIRIKKQLYGKPN